MMLKESCQTSPHVFPHDGPVVTFAQVFSQSLCVKVLGTHTHHSWWTDLAEGFSGAKKKTGDQLTKKNWTTEPFFFKGMIEMIKYKNAINLVIRRFLKVCFLSVFFWGGLRLQR